MSYKLMARNDEFMLSMSFPFDERMLLNALAEKIG
jgi:hypothetical protein